MNRSIESFVTCVQENLKTWVVGASNGKGKGKVEDGKGHERA